MHHAAFCDTHNGTARAPQLFARGGGHGTGNRSTTGGVDAGFSLTHNRLAPAPRGPAPRFSRRMIACLITIPQNQESPVNPRNSSSRATARLLAAAAASSLILSVSLPAADKKPLGKVLMPLGDATDMMDTSLPLLPARLKKDTRSLSPARKHGCTTRCFTRFRQTAMCPGILPRRPRATVKATGSPSRTSSRRSMRASSFPAAARRSTFATTRT